MFLATGFFSVLLSIVVFILVIGTIILIHEFGHFVFARRAGILCHEFSIGMGPVLYQHKFKETTFSIRAIPIGGFVSMAGEEISDSLLKKDQRIGLMLNEDGKVNKIILMDSDSCDVYGNVISYNLYGINGEELNICLDEDGEEKTYLVCNDAYYVLSKKQQLQITPYNRCFESKSLGKRFLTLFAGPAMNFVLAIFIYFIYWCAMGVPNLNSTKIGSVSNGYPSSEYLKANDEIVSVNGVEVSSWNEFSAQMNLVEKKYDTSVNLVVKRNNEDINLNLPLIVIINSCGLNNVGVATSTDNYGYEGIIMGDDSALNYKGNLKKDEIKLATGDVITKIRVDKVISKSHVEEGSFVSIESWSHVMEILDNVDVANLYFEFYSVEEKEITTTKTPIQTHGNELLDNQRIEKITVKIGVTPVYHFSLGGAFVNTFTSFWSDFTLIFKTLKILLFPSGIRQVGVSNLSGVVGIFSMVDSYIQYGILPLLALVALLSINIGVMNLLPIPALDGGRIVFLLYEAITRKKPNKKFENILNNIMFILLMILFVYVTFNDILRLFK